MLKSEVFTRIRKGADPTWLGMAGGIKAHAIQDWCEHAGQMYVRTRAHGWHCATAREVCIINKQQE